MSRQRKHKRRVYASIQRDRSAIVWPCDRWWFNAHAIQTHQQDRFSLNRFRNAS